MSDANSLINLGDISKPATVLIEKISNAIGCLYQPTQIKRIAQAEAEAGKIKALAEVEVSDIQRRALVRVLTQEGKRQENIENITGNATADLKEDANPQDIDDDWIAHFFDKCKDVSGSEMQSLWSRLLAGEANRPGSYSKRTLELVSILEKTDAHLFSKLCSFAIAGGDTFPIILDTNSTIYTEQGITFSSLNHLDSLGLIKFDNIQTFSLNNLPQNINLSYFGIPIVFKLLSESNNSFEIGRVVLTKTGQQLAPICGAEINLAFLKYMMDEYKKRGYGVTSAFG
ncbi:hypothetical protein GMLC_20520 [Geomonas limicola]|uniref:DUF2806 domain-containing protein n=1 Tax=Geomonas limicola TaxID=2740186 RepID=A0A6V8NAB3_9BACT|nr:DUF2806 domain-containing protein [Geomonas limicola]GFO68473.1 hypothetical protein GMLC_20520 [Geomonas limicola]